MTRAILSCNGLDKPEGAVAREVAIRAAAATGGEIICPVLLNRAPARYKKALSESTVIVVDGCSTRCASKLADSLEIKVDRKVLVSDVLKSSGMTLEPVLTLGPHGLGLVKAVVDGLLQSLNAPSEPAPSTVSSIVFAVPTDHLVVTHDKFEFRIPAADFMFNENDVWVRVVGDVARVGISDYMQQSLTDINYFDAPKTETAVDQFGELGSLESSKAVFEIIAPASGMVVAVNAEVVANPGLINEDPYGKGWLVEMKPSSWPEDREFLLEPDAYAKTVKHKAEEA